jgi:hypothetical protein
MAHREPVGETGSRSYWVYSLSAHAGADDLVEREPIFDCLGLCRFPLS